MDCCCCSSPYYSVFLQPTELIVGSPPKVRPTILDGGRGEIISGTSNFKP